MRLKFPFLAALTTAALFALPALAQAQAAPEAEVFKVDPVHSTVGFKVRHLVGKVSGTFAEFSGSVTVPDRGKPEVASVRFVIRAASIDTANADRDKHLRGADFFETDKFPEITFESTKVEAKGADSYLVTGKFTMHGVTKEIVLPLTFGGTVKDPWGNERAGFSLQTVLNRKDYGVVWNKAMDAGGLVLGDDVEVAIDLELVKAKPGQV